jgi:hypothetical protein
MLVAFGAARGLSASGGREKFEPLSAVTIDHILFDVLQILELGCKIKN